MNRTRSLSGIMGPPTDRDVVMGPPPIPPPLGPPQPPALPQKSKETQEIVDKYKRLKRRYFELEEVGSFLTPVQKIFIVEQKHKETESELMRSGERNVKMREEREYVLVLLELSIALYPLVQPVA
jgi:hypothetical protein